MLYARVDTETKEILEFPIQPKVLKQRLLEMNISLPSDIYSADLSSFGYYKVEPDSKQQTMQQSNPPAGYRKVLGMPVWEEGVLKRVWIDVPIDPDFRNRLWKKTRELRNNLLRESDWTEFPSVRVTRSEEWASAWDKYRQELRDMTNVEHPTMVQFPEKPRQ